MSRENHIAATTVTTDPVVQRWLDGAQARLEEAKQTGNPAAVQAALDALWELLTSLENQA